MRWLSEAIVSVVAVLVALPLIAAIAVLILCSQVQRAVKSALMRF
jgi:hypothetical protein